MAANSLWWKKPLRALAAVFCFVGAGGCIFPRSLDVAPDKIQDLAGYRESRHVQVLWNGQAVLVDETNFPQLELELKQRCCPPGQVEDCQERIVRVPLEQMQLSEGKIEIQRPTPDDRPRCQAVLLSNIFSAQLQLEAFVPPGYEPRWAVGLMAAGPGLAVSIDGQFFATPWLVLQAGVGLLPVSLGGNYGFRLRPLHFGAWRPFVGMSHHGYMFEYNNYVHHALVARMGVDVELFYRNILLSFELDALFPFNPDQYSLGRLKGNVIPWGGISVSGLF